jgi:hypothetical protein
MVSALSSLSASPHRGTPLLRARWLLLLLWAAWLVPRGWSALDGDWHYFAAGGALLFGPDGLHVFARHPELHMGPLSLVAAWLLQPFGDRGLAGAEILMWALGPATLFLLERAATAIRGAGDPLVAVTTLAGGFLFLDAWMEAAGPIGHIDDVLAMTFVALALLAVATERPALAGLAVGLAIAAKPWGIIVLPLCLAFPPRALLRSFGVAVGVGMVAWLPFVAVDRGTIGAGSYDQLNDAASALRALGVDALATPDWVRPAQVLLALAFGIVAVRIGRWPAVVPVALAGRIALDPAVFTYYAPTLVLGGLACDLLVSRRPLPMWTLVTFVAVAAVPTSVAAHVRGDLRLAACVALILGALVLPAAEGLRRPRTQLFGSGAGGEGAPATP